MKKLVRFIPNSITISRVGLSILFIIDVTGQFVYGKNNLINLIVVFAAVCLTDFLDGRIARKLHSTSAIGAELDVFADLFFITASNITLLYLGLLPPWFLGFVFLKFIEFIMTSNFIIRHNYLPNKDVFIFDKVGKLVSAMFFVAPGAACIIHVIMPDIAENLISFLLYSILLGGILSSYVRIRNCFKLIHTN